jgi:dolichol-phosphate mannosyltransferase
MGNSLVLLPTYNERENLPRVLPRLAALEEEVDVLVIDDASPDGTGEIAEALRARFSHLSVLHRRTKEGLGRAYIHGFKVALERGYRRIVTMDADLSHAPEDVPRLLGALEEADVAIGSRHVPGGGVENWPLWRRLLSRCGSYYARSLLRLPIADVTGGFRAYRADTLRELDLDRTEAQGFVFQIEILRRILDLPGTRATEVPIVFRNRLLGRSKMSAGVISEAAWEVASLLFRKKPRTERSYEPLHTRNLFEPGIAVVIPAPPTLERPQAVGGLESLSLLQEKLEIMVARGRCPSRQRNLAVKETKGDYILFLDDDSLVTKDLLKGYLSVLERDPTVGAVGGPAESLRGSPFQDIASSILEEPWVMGRSASRYRARGKPRFTDERELILCNLCVRRQAFEALGGFDERLYPNEENEFLERLRLAGWRMVYRPEAAVRRPQRESLRDFLRTIVRYGSGRVAQARFLASRVSIARLGWVAVAVVMAVTGLIGFVGGPAWLAIPLLAYTAYLTALCSKLAFRVGLRKGVCGTHLSVLLHGAYAWGILRGLLEQKRPTDEEVVLEQLQLCRGTPKRRSCA